MGDCGETKYVCSSNESSYNFQLDIYCDSRGVRSPPKLSAALEMKAADTLDRLVLVSKGSNSEIKVCNRRGDKHYNFSKAHYNKEVKRTLHSSMKTKSALMSTGEM